MGKYLNKKIIDSSNILSTCFRIYTKWIFFIKPDKRYLEDAYKRRFKKKLNWENPLLFQEKLLWLNLNYRTDIHTQCADKISVRDYVAERIGDLYLIPQLQILSKAESLEPQNLPDIPFIIKCNHNSAGYTIVMDKSTINWNKERIKFSNLLKQNYYYQSREWQYKNINPKIIIEKLLLDDNNEIPFDYKFNCFNGEPINIHVGIKRKGISYIVFFDLNWQKLSLKSSSYSNATPFLVKKPKKLQEMINLAMILAKDFPFARIDFYQNGDDIKFGEITFHPGAGLEYYEPDFYNAELGNLINLEKIKKLIT